MENICQKINELVKSKPNRIFKIFIDRGIKLRLKDSLEKSIILAKWMVSKDLEKGDRIAILMGNNPEYVLLTYAAALLGLEIVPINIYANIDEIKKIVDETNSKLLFFDSLNIKIPNEEAIRSLNSPILHCNDIWENDKCSYGILGLKSILDSTDFSSEITIKTEEMFKNTDITDDFAIMYTSGSTGDFKGIVKSFCSFIGGPEGMNRITRFMIGLIYETRLLNVFGLCPYYHYAGFTILMLPMYGIDLKETTIDHFNPDRAIDAIDKDYSRILLGTPSMISLITHKVKERSKLLKNIYLVILIGATSDKHQTIQIEKILKSQLIFSNYGSTECGAIANRIIATKYLTFGIKVLIKLANMLKIIDKFNIISDFHVEKGNLLGIVCKSVEVKIRDSFTGEYLEDGICGEICVRSKANSKKYYNSDQLNERVFLKDGFVLTGDLGIISGNMLFSKGRLKNLIIRGGENITPYEIEDILLQHDNVKSVVVCGVPSDLYGEEVCACIIQKEPTEANIDYNSFLKSKLSKIKLPSYYLLFNEFTLNGSGKIDIKSIRKNALNQLGICEEK